MTSFMNGKREGFFTSETFRVGAASVTCRWRLVAVPCDTKVSRHFRTLDLLLNFLPLGKDGGFLDSTACLDATGTAIDTTLRHLDKLGDTAEVALKVILAPSGGYVCMSNILSLRVQPSDVVEAVIPLATWDQHLPPLSLHADASLLDFLHSSPGVVVAKRSQLKLEPTLSLLDQYLDRRLEFSWMLPTKPVPRTVAVIAGRPMHEPKRGIYWSQGYFEAAQALGISIIVLDESGHWLEGPEYAHLRHEFIAIDLFNIEDLPRNIATILKGRQIDGLVTFTDDFVIATAEAAEMLGLPTEPSQVMRDTHLKHRVRELITSNIPTTFLHSVKQLDDPALSEKIGAVDYPLIVKPTRGVYSRGVQKVEDGTGLLQAVHTLEEDGLAEAGILLEPYIDGPEIDGNFALWDGQVLFLEVCDNFPCLGDAGTGISNNFSETVQLSHSGLPPNELETIRSTLHSHLLQLGFQSGVFHVEARMKNSSMRYQVSKDHGILDLVITSSDDRKSNILSSQPECFLIEVNARPPGAGGSWATFFTYGVDLRALQLLRVINDGERFRILSVPFSLPAKSPGGGGGAQYWTAHCMIPVHRADVYVPEDFFEKVYQIVPDIEKNACRAELYAQPGTVVSPIGGVGWIGYLLLRSRTSRSHAIRMYDRVVEAARMVLDRASET